MHKMNKLYSFHISKLEQDSIRVFRENNINVSEFLRRSLRDMAKEINLKEIKTEPNKELTNQVISNLLLWLQRESLS